MLWVTMLFPVRWRAAGNVYTATSRTGSTVAELQILDTKVGGRPVAKVLLYDEDEMKATSADPRIFHQFKLQFAQVPMLEQAFVSDYSF
tara:strand:- start:862 stop:1128 length:267 start_codon:yes stop_codon:yes gene_type:complete